MAREALTTLKTSAGRRVSYRLVTADTTLAVTDELLLVDTSAGNRLISLPTAASMVGFVYEVKKKTIDLNFVIIDPNGSEVFEYNAPGVPLQFNDYGACYSFFSDGTQWWLK